MYAAHLKASVAIADKIRHGHGERAEIIELVGDVAGHDVLIVDDFSTTGSTLVSVSDELKRRGARRQVACLSHVLLKPEGIDRIEHSAIEIVISTDSVHNTYLTQSTRIRIVSAAPLFAEALRRIHSRESVSSLFERMPARIVKSSMPPFPNSPSDD